MVEPSRAERIARQSLRTDRIWGQEAVPISAEPPDLDPEPEAEPQPAVSSSSGEPSARQPAGDPVENLLDRPIEETGMSRDEKAEALAALEREMSDWLQAEWPQNGWNRMVFGEGDPNAELMFIGEGPGADEDAQGRPFVGRAGQLLDKQIVAMGLNREDVYIANILKTRPPGNRAPTPDEASQQMPYLLRQIETICPKVIVGLGSSANKYLLDNPKLAITKQRGQWKKFRGIDLMPTFHPAYLLRQYTKENRARVWSDLQAVMQQIGLK